MTEWISITDRLADPEIDILLYNKEEGILKGKMIKTADDEYVFYTECFKSHKEFYASHWMPLPEVPNG